MVGAVVAFLFVVVMVESDEREAREHTESD